MGDGYIRNRGTRTNPIYQLRIWVGGRRIEIAARTPDGVRCATRDQAEAALHFYRQAAIDGSLDTSRRAKRSALTVSALCDRFIADYHGTRVRDHQRYRRDSRSLLLHVRRAVGPHLASSVTSADVEHLKAGLLQDHGAATVRHVLIRMRSMYRWAIRMQLARRDPTAGVDLPAVAAPDAPLDPDRYFTQSEVETLLGYTAQHEPDWHAYLALAATTGMRPPSELHKLRWTDIDLEAETIRIRRSKVSGKDVTVHLHPLALAALRGWRQRPWHTATSPVFARPLPARRGKPAGSRLPDPSYAVRQVQRCYEAAGVRVLDAYALRHTALTLAADGGMGLLELSALGGHRSLQTTRRYLHEQDRRADAAIAAIRITPRPPEERGAPGATPTKPSLPRKVGRHKQRGPGSPRERG